MPEAYRHLGVRRIPGPENHPEIMKFFEDAGHPQKHENIAYCAAFANACLERVGIVGTNSLLARSFLQWGMKVTEPRYGDIVVISRGKESWMGHVFFFTRMDDKWIYGIGGNQSDAQGSGAVTEARYARSRLLGFRRPSMMPELVKASKPVLPKESAPAGIVGTGILAFLASEEGIGLIVVALVLLALTAYYLWPEKPKPEFIKPSARRRTSPRRR